MAGIKEALNKKADLALLQMESLHENLMMVHVEKHGESEWLAFYNSDLPRSKKTALKRQIVELRQTLKVISDMLDC